MTRILLLSVLLILACSTSMALGPDFGIGAQVNFTSSHFPGPSVGSGSSAVDNAYGVGWGGGLHVDANLMVLSFRLSGDYIHYSADENKFRDAFRPLFGNATNLMSINGGGLGVYSLTVSGHMPVLPLPLVTPYITGGLGLAWVNRDQMTTSIAGVAGTTIPSNTQGGKTSLDVGVGADVKVGVSLFLEVKYAWIFTDGATFTYVPVSVGVTF